jgi:hypothetical protein
MKSLLASIFVLAFCFAAFGQDSLCPTISLTEPQSVTKPGENITFTINVDGKTENLKLT